MDLGADYRYDDIFATNGLTSDQTQKQKIVVASAKLQLQSDIRGLVKTVAGLSLEVKSDDASIHCGVIAQEEEQAFADEGLARLSLNALFTK